MYTTGEALNYIQQQMAGRPGLQIPNWTSPTSGVGWLRLHRENGNLDFQVDYQGSRPRFVYAQENLDAFLDALAEIKVGRPKADFSMLTQEQLSTLTAEEIARRAGVGIKTVYLARMKGDIPRHKPGRPARQEQGPEDKGPVP